MQKLRDVFINDNEARLKPSEAAAKELEELTDGMEQTDSGLYYKINREGSRSPYKREKRFGSLQGNAARRNSI